MEREPERWTKRDGERRRAETDMEPERKTDTERDRQTGRQTDVARWGEMNRGMGERQTDEGLARPATAAF